MFDIAAEVARARSDGDPVTVVRVIETHGISSRDATMAAAFVGEMLLAGSVLSGAADKQLGEALAVTGSGARLETFVVSEDDAAYAGLSCGGSARVLLQPAEDIPDEAWRLFEAHTPACLVTELRGEGVAETRVFTAASIAQAGSEAITRVFQRGVSETVLLTEDDRSVVVSAGWPVPLLQLVGSGAIADALSDVAGLLGWRARTVLDAGAAADACARLSVTDAAIVLSHDLDLSGAALVGALRGSCGYVGALGSSHTQSARAQWLTEHGVRPDELERIHGPAGLDLGARTPVEIAIAIIAELMMIRAGSGGSSLRDQPGPAHRPHPPGMRPIRWSL